MRIITLFTLIHGDFCLVPRVVLSIVDPIPCIFSPSSSYYMGTRIKFTHFHGYSHQVHPITWVFCIVVQLVTWVLVSSSHIPWIFSLRLGRFKKDWKDFRKIKGRLERLKEDWEDLRKIGKFIQFHGYSHQVHTDS